MTRWLAPIVAVLGLALGPAQATSHHKVGHITHVVCVRAPRQPLLYLCERTAIHTQPQVVKRGVGTGRFRAWLVNYREQPL